jgi:hypothetical protein
MVIYIIIVLLLLYYYNYNFPSSFHRADPQNKNKWKRLINK